MSREGVLCYIKINELITLAEEILRQHQAHDMVVTDFSYVKT